MEKEAVGVPSAEITLPPGMRPQDVEKILAAAAKKTAAHDAGDYVEFANFESGIDQIRVYRDVYKGRETFNIRRFYQDEAGEWRHGKGVAFHDEDAPTIIEGLTAMIEWIEENPTEKKAKKGDSELTQQGDD